MSILINGFNVANNDIKTHLSVSEHHNADKIFLEKDRFVRIESKNIVELLPKEEWCCDRATD